jgi:alkylation response protein AidB-like acyl-CoA dehydrogenase
MYFDLTEEQKSIAQTLEGFLRDRIDEARAVQLFDAGVLDRELWRELMSLGLGGILVPMQQNGLGSDLVTLAVVAEILGSRGVPAPATANALAGWLIATCGDSAMKERWLAPVMGGEAVAAFALFETDRGWLEKDWRMAGPRVTGSKRYVEWGDIADVLVVGLEDGLLGIVDAHSPRLKIERCDSLDRSRPLAHIQFEGAAADVMHDPSGATRLVDALLVLSAADACGAGLRAYRMAVEYANTRTQFGQIIGKFQALKHQLANMAIDMEPCRPLHWYAAHAWDAIPHKQRRIAATAKAHITDMAVKTARAAVEAHGGIGYTWEYPLHIYLKRAMHSRISMGSPAVHRERMAQMAEW